VDFEKESQGAGLKNTDKLEPGALIARLPGEKHMNITEIRKEMDELEQRLLILIQEFENKTDCSVASVFGDRVEMSHRKEKTHNVRIEVVV
jgi:hypothetical protein